MHICTTNQGVSAISTQLYKGFPWFTRWYWLIRFDFTTVSCGDSGQSGLTLHLFPVETIVKSNLIGQNKRIVQWKCFIQLGAGRCVLSSTDRSKAVVPVSSNVCVCVFICLFICLYIYLFVTVLLFVRLFVLYVLSFTLTTKNYK